jgi:hypothetical protein
MRFLIAGIVRLLKSGLPHTPTDINKLTMPLAVVAGGASQGVGKLLRTAQGLAMRGDPVRLWWRLVEKTPPHSTDACETQAGLIFLVATAAEIRGEVHAIVADLFGGIGWMSADGSPLTRSMASHAAWKTAAVLRRLGAFTDEHDSHRRERPTPDGVTFARAALTSWPTRQHHSRTPTRL